MGLFRRLSIASLALAAALPAQAAESLSALLKSTPSAPVEKAAAAAWVQNGSIVQPDYVAFVARLDAEKAAIAQMEAQAASKNAVPAAQDSPPVLAAVAGYQAYAAAHSGANAPAEMLRKRMVWISRRFATLSRPRPHGGTDPELGAWQALFNDWQNSRSTAVGTAQSQLAAAGDPAAVQSGANLLALARYRAAMIAEIEALLSITRTAVESAAKAPPG